MIFPDAWEHYLAPIPVEERGDLIAAYHKRLSSSDEAVMLEAAKAWSIWEGSTSKLFPDPEFISKFAGDKFSLAFAKYVLCLGPPCRSPLSSAMPPPQDREPLLCARRLV